MLGRSKSHSFNGVIGKGMDYKLLEESDNSNYSIQNAAVVQKPLYCRFCFNNGLTKLQLIILIIIIIIFTLISSMITIVFGFGQIIAEKAISDAVLGFTSVEISEPNGTSSFIADVEGYIESGFPASAEVYTMYLKVLYKQHIIGYFTAPPLYISYGKNPVKIRSLFNINNHTSFSIFAHDTISSDKVTWELSSKVTLKAYGQTYSNIPFHKNITLSGCRGLKELIVYNATFTNSTKTDIITDIYLNIHNPSVFILSPLGHLRFYVTYNNSIIGYISSYIPSMVHGDQIVHLNGYLKPSDPYITGIIFSEYLGGINANITAHGVSSDVMIWNDSVACLELSTPLPGRQDPIISSLEFENLHVFPKNDAFMNINGNLSAYFNNPLGNNSFLLIKKVRLSYLSFYTIDQTFLGSITGDWITIPSQPTPDSSVLITIPPLSFRFPHDKGIGFADYCISLYQQSLVPLSFNGYLDIVIDCPVGIMTLSHLPLSIIANMSGMDNLPNGVVEYFQLSDNNNNSLSVSVDASIYNPSFLSLSLPPVQYYLYGTYNNENIFIGYSSSPAFTLSQGSNSLSLSGIISPHKDKWEEMTSIFNNYFTKQSQEFKVSQYLPTKIFWIDRLLSSIFLRAELPPLNTSQINSLINSIEFQLIYFDYLHYSLPTLQTNLHIGLKNPYNVSYSINSCSYDITILTQNTTHPQPVFTLNYPQFQTSFVPHNQTVIASTPTAPITILDVDLFSDMINIIMTEPQVNFTLYVTSYLNISLGIGYLFLKNITVQKELSLKSLNNFKNNILNSTRIDITSGDFIFISSFSDIYLYNPTIFGFNIGSVNIDVYYLDTTVYVSNFPEFKISPGNNSFLDQFGYFKKNTFPVPYHTDQSIKFLSNFGNQINCICSVKALPLSSPYPPLYKALENFNAKVNVPGLSHPSVVSSTFYINAADFIKICLGIKKEMDCSVFIFNSFYSQCNYSRVSWDINFPKNNFTLAIFEMPEDMKIVVPANTMYEVRSSFQIKSVWNLSDLEFFWNELVDGHAKVHVYGHEFLEFDNFKVMLNIDVIINTVLNDDTPPPTPRSLRNMTQFINL